MQKVLAWMVHLYTATGLLLAAAIAVLLVRGDPQALHWSLVLMLVATVIDGTDGWLARRARVKEIIPSFDGRRLDDIVDFHTYTSLPLLLIWRAGLLPAGQEWWLLLPLLASAYGFSQVDAKTDDGFFLGFPSYWNVVAFYLYMLRPSPWLALVVIIGLALLTFVPSRYLYPSQNGRFNRATNILSALWVVLLVIILARVADDTKPLLFVSLSFPIYYLVLSWALSLHHWRQGRTYVKPR
jgi:phosphatidylcholine synthase